MRKYQLDIHVIKVMKHSDVIKGLVNLDWLVRSYMYKVTGTQKH